MGSHLKFVGALMKQAQLKTRLERLAQLKGVGVVNLYTSLGENGYWTGGYFVPRRTFCAVPTEKEAGALFVEQANPKAANEIEAHCSMFRAEKNPRYEEMVGGAKELVVKWVDVDPRKVVDDYQPDVRQRAQSVSEENLFDDDGKLQDASKADGTTEDEIQLEAILKSTQMPLPEDGGVDEEALKLAAAVPLPLDEEASMTWKSRITNPLKGVSIPPIPKPSVSLPKSPSFSMPKIPTFRMPMKRNRDGGSRDDSTPEEKGEPARAMGLDEENMKNGEDSASGQKEEAARELKSDAHHPEKTILDEASQVPLPVEVLENPPSEARLPSVDSGVVTDIYEVAKE